MCAVQQICCGLQTCRRRTAGVAWRQGAAGCAPTSTAAAARCGSAPCTPACRAKPSPRQLSGPTALQASYSLVSILLVLKSILFAVQLCVCHNAYRTAGFILIGQHTPCFSHPGCSPCKYSSLCVSSRICHAFSSGYQTGKTAHPRRCRLFPATISCFLHGHIACDVLCSS